MVLVKAAACSATLGEGFGVKSFEVSFLNKDGSPDTQAGSHPYELRQHIEYNSHFVRTESNADSRYVQEPDGALKDLYVDFPPGVVGDPNATREEVHAQRTGRIQRKSAEGKRGGCPEGPRSANWKLRWSAQIPAGNEGFVEPVFNMVPPRGVALQLGINYINPDLFINNVVCWPVGIIRSRRRS